jgi:hypothetical protein
VADGPISGEAPGLAPTMAGHFLRPSAVAASVDGGERSIRTRSTRECACRRTPPARLRLALRK